MHSIWSGSISNPGSHELKDIALYDLRQDACPSWSNDASISFLSVVLTTQIPLHMILGPRCLVTTQEAQSRTWFENILFKGKTNDQDDAIERKWWEHARLNSPLGILFGIHGGPSYGNDSNIKVTELLVFASCDLPSSTERLPTPPRSSPTSYTEDLDGTQFRIFAVPLSSDLLQVQPGDDLTPPTSPQRNRDNIEGTFLSSITTTGPTEPVNLLSVRKRKNVTDAFDAATDRLRKARRQGGEGIAAAAAASGVTRVDDAIQSFRHRRSVSNSYPPPMQTRPLSRASSIASARPSSARDQFLPTLAKRSSLSTVKSVPDIVEPQPQPEIEIKNKDVISRIVMAGMRLHGLSQNKSRKLHSDSASASPAPHAEDVETQRKQDDEYKLVYHQVYKGTCFSFRHHLTEATLNQNSEAIREIVDKLLGLYCTDPLTSNLVLNDEKLTPRGRKAFGSALSIPNLAV